jgi:hypothetical protein
MSDVVQKLWGFCHTLRHDGIDYGDYIEQITYLLFLKLSDERGIDLTKIKMRSVDDPKTTTTLNCSWPALTPKAGTDLTDYYANVLRALRQQEGSLGDILLGTQSRFNKPTRGKEGKRGEGKSTVMVGFVFSCARGRRAHYSKVVSFSLAAQVTCVAAGHFSVSTGGSARATLVDIRSSKAPHCFIGCMRSA